MILKRRLFSKKEDKALRKENKALNREANKQKKALKKEQREAMKKTKGEVVGAKAKLGKRSTTFAGYENIVFNTPITGVLSNRAANRAAERATRSGKSEVEVVNAARTAARRTALVANLGVAGLAAGAAALTGVAALPVAGSIVAHHRLIGRSKAGDAGTAIALDRINKGKGEASYASRWHKHKKEVKENRKMKAEAKAKGIKLPKNSRTSAYWDAPDPLL